MSVGVKVHEIFFSLQGESTRAGLPTVFIRLAGCNLRCGYCDTSDAWESGDLTTVEEIVGKVAEFDCRLVEITGGEPMLQENTPKLARKLLADGYTVMMETNGTANLSSMPKEVAKIVDIKCPESGATDSFLYENLELLTQNDEIKFVVSSKDDFNWSAAETVKRNLFSICTVNVSPVHGKVAPADLAAWILESGLPFRLNFQIHKYLNLP